VQAGGTTLVYPRPLLRFKDVVRTIMTAVMGER